MAVSRIRWKPQKMFAFLADDSDGKKKKDESDMLLDELLSQGGDSPMVLSGSERNDAFTSSFESKVGGLSPQIESIVRRVLDGRIIRPADPNDEIPSYMDQNDNDDNSNSNNNDDQNTPSDLTTATLESEELALLGLTPVRGLLLYGPPGCGKTVLAREISHALRARQPKILSAPELLDRWVGGSERLVRDLFVDAEAELAVCGGDASRSALHVVVIDEIDAVFRRRTGGEDSGEATRGSVVNQILAKLDGIDAIPNVLLIGMTNRRELLDNALLRPGRLEVQIEIPLPDEEGRREIMKIHFGALRERGRVSRPLCRAIDGVSLYDEDEGGGGSIDGSSTDNAVAAVATPTTGRKRRAIKRTVTNLLSVVPGNTIASYAHYDLAADYVTRGFSGADIAGLVRCAGSIALSRARKDGGGVQGLMITLEDVKQALVEVKR